jgi:hypothetical protein
MSNEIYGGGSGVKKSTNQQRFIDGEPIKVFFLSVGLINSYFEKYS